MSTSGDAGTRRRLKVLVVSQHYWPERFRVTDMAEDLALKGHEVDVLCGLPNYPTGRLEDGYRYFSPRKQWHNGVTIYRAGEVLRKGNTTLRIFLNYVSFPMFALFNLFRLVGKKHDRVFCFQSSPVLMAFPAIVYAWLKRLPLTLYVGDLWPENLYSVLPVRSRFWQRVAFCVSRWHYAKAHRLIAVSPSMRRRLIDMTGKDGASVYSVPQYCEDFYEQDKINRASELPSSNVFTVLSAGNISPAQGLDILIPVARRLEEEGIKDIRFVLVGEGMSKGGLEAAVAKAGLERWFSFEGQKQPEEIPAYQAAADVLLVTLVKSKDLGLTVPSRLTSCIAAGKPILASMDGEGAALVRAARCGLVSGAGDAQALADNLLALHSMTPEERAQFGISAIAYHRKHLKRELLLSRIEEILLMGREEENVVGSRGESQ